MTDTLKFILSIGLLVFFQLTAKTQVQEIKSHLQKVGLADSLYSEILGETRTIYIQFPAYYNPAKNKKYPVAFILDGEVLLPAVAAVESYYSGGFIPDMLMVGISNANKRTRDLTTSKVTVRHSRQYNVENGGADQFIEFIEKELFPYVENKYPVTKYRSLIGHSFGGLFTIYALIHKPDLFANYLAIDPSLDWDGQKLLNEAKEILGRHNYENKALFMSLSGQLHMQNPNITLENVMQDSSDFTLFSRSNIAFANLQKDHEENGLSFHWKFYPKDLHGTVPFPSIMDGLISMFEWFQMEKTDRINSFDTPKEELLEIVKYREQKLHSHFGYLEAPYPEDLLNISGYMNMDMNQKEKAKMYFELAMEYYPQSPNVYDSMADYYEAEGDKETALKFVLKAAALSGDDSFEDKIRRLKGE